MKLLLVSAADRRYGWAVMNLVASMQANSRVFDEVVVFDLGLSRWQKATLRAAGVSLGRVSPFAPHWRQCWSWKPWIWSHADAEIVLYLDAGTTILRSLNGIIAEIQETGYFLVSQEHPVRDMVPSDYAQKYGLTESQLSSPTVGAGIVGFKTSGAFYEQVVKPTYEDVIEGHNLGWSESEYRTRNLGINHMPTFRVHDCPIFRHDQTLFNIHVYRTCESPVVHPMAKYAGLRRDDAHDQVIWHHRLNSSFPYLESLSLPRRWQVAHRLAIRVEPRWRPYSKFFHLSSYVRRAKELLGIPEFGRPLREEESPTRS